jgi:hypothetical protein
MNHFNLAHLQALPFDDAKEYVKKYFIPLIDNSHAFNYKGEWIIKSKEEIKDVFFNRLSDELNHFYYREYNNILVPTWDKNKPQFYEDYINFDCKKEDDIIKPYRFLLDSFILQKRGLNHKPTDLFKQYVEYSNDSTMKKEQFMKAIEHVGLKPVKSGTNLYKINCEDLYNIGLSNEWLFLDKRDIECDVLRKENDELKRRIVELESVEYVNIEMNDVAVGTNEDVAMVEKNDVAIGTDDDVAVVEKNDVAIGTGDDDAMNDDVIDSDDDNEIEIESDDDIDVELYLDNDDESLVFEGDDLL